MEDVIYLSDEDVEIVDTAQYSYDIAENFDAAPELQVPCVRLEELMYLLQQKVSLVAVKRSSLFYIVRGGQNTKKRV